MRLKFDRRKAEEASIGEGKAWTDHSALLPCSRPNFQSARSSALHHQESPPLQLAENFTDRGASHMVDENFLWPETSSSYIESETLRNHELWELTVFDYRSTWRIHQRGLLDPP